VTIRNDAISGAIGGRTRFVSGVAGAVAAAGVVATDDDGATAGLGVDI
jgi:phage-related protein